jgi:hypothetical protein
MPKKIKIFLLIVASPLLFMVVVNECFDVPKRTDKYVPEQCTWYCHNVTCLHFKTSYEEKPSSFKKMNKTIFDWYVTSLHGNTLNLNYRNINLLVFIFVYPLLGSLLVWNLIRKVK